MKIIIIAESGPSRSIVSVHDTLEAAKAALRRTRKTDGFGYRIVDDYRVTQSVMASDLIQPLSVP